MTGTSSRPCCARKTSPTKGTARALVLSPHRERPGHPTARSPHRRQDHARDRRATDPIHGAGRTLAPPLPNVREPPPFLFSPMPSQGRHMETLTQIAIWNRALGFWAPAASPPRTRTRPRPCNAACTGTVPGGRPCATTPGPLPSAGPGWPGGPALGLRAGIPLCLRPARGLPQSA